uniref:Microtubule actin crosslinking factor 1 n=1 Tax=Taeniopygia guttata TaxID=59729 RepID=H0YSU6_TAEGU
MEQKACLELPHRYERDRVQKKTFTKWVNKHLMKVRKHINDLYEDLRDGHNLISLLEVLSGVKLVSPQGWAGILEPREKGRMRFHRLQNVQIALDFLKQRQVKLVNIRNDDITDGNPKLTLGLIWTIILHFQISDIYISGELGDMSAKEKLLLWTQKVTAGYIGLKCTNFSSCWSDGKMFNALIHRYRPDLVDMERVQIQSNRENLEQAFEIAERLGVTRLLDAEDVDVPSPDEKSVITYVSSIYDAFPKVPEGGEGISAIEVDSRWLEYQTRVESLISWIKQHTILMSDKSFPQNPVELKALYNQYIHFKETEIPAKEQEKGQIEELYKLLEVWIEFGRIKLPQGYHPNDVEEEWGKLIIEMLEREKLLRPAVERLELLLQIANKIQNGALSCEEKLTLAKNTLQADAAHLESGQPVQYESDVVVYLQECEGLLRQLQVDVQILRDENYYQLEELVFRLIVKEIMRLQDELVTLRLECTNLYRKGHFSTLELVPTSTLSTTHLKGESLTKGLHTSSASWFRKPMTRTELVAISSSEDEGSLRFVYELLAWVEEMQVSMRLERAEWGTDLPSVESQLETQRHIHASVEDLGSSVKEARMYEGKMSPNFRASYTETLGKLETQYCKLMETSSFRLRHLQSLHGFVSRATAELIWLNEKEEEELAYDWSDNNPNIAAKKNYFSELTAELEEKQDIFRSLQDTAELLSLENHPAKQTVEAYSAAVHTQWQWIKQLCLCVEQHVKENAAYFQFFSDARELETYLRNLQDSIKRKYSCDHNTSLTRLEDLLQDSMDEKEQLIQSKSSVASLVGRSKTIVQLRPRNPEQAVKSTIPIRAVCDYRQIEITICRNDECVLEDNSQRTKWKVISPTGNEAMVPSVCFLIPPPNKEAIEMASRVEQLYQKVMALWHQLHMNTKSLISWNYLRKDIALVQSFSMEKGECQQALKSLQAHYEDFLQDSRDSELFSMSDRLRLEEEVESSKEHIRQLLESMENGELQRTLARSYLSELKNIRLRLEECEQRLVSRIQSPSSARADGDTIQENAIRMAEQERTQADLQQLQSELRVVSQRCCSFLDKAPAGPSTPHLRSELDLVVNKMEQTHGLSSIYLEKLKTVDIIIRSTQGAESLVKGYEVKLSQEEAVPADLAAIQTHRQWLGEVKDKGSVFSTLEEEMAKAKEVGEQLLRLRQERSIDLERFQEKGSQLWDRWQRACAQIETRHTELESIQEVLSDYRQCHRALIQWIEEITAQQELMKPGQAEDSRVLSEQLSQQTVRQDLVMSPCCRESHKLHISPPSQDYELQLMTYRAFVESQQKSPMKRRRMLSSSDAITQEFMDLRTRYTALVTLTTQHVKYISDALRRLEEEEVRPCIKILPFFFTFFFFQALNEELTAKKEQVSEAIKTSQIFLAKHMLEMLDSDLILSLLFLFQGSEAVAGVIDLGTVEIFPVFGAMQRGLIDQDTGLALLEAQVISSDLVVPETSEKLSLEKALARNIIDLRAFQVLQELKDALQQVEEIRCEGRQLLPVVAAIEEGRISESHGLKILEAELITGGFKFQQGRISMETAVQEKLLPTQLHSRLLSHLEGGKDLIDPNTAEKISLPELLERCIIHQETGLRLLPVKQLAGGMVSLRSGREVSIFRAVQEGLIDRQVTIRLLEAHLFAGGIVDPRTGHRLTVDEAVRHNLIDQDLACTLLIRQLQTGGIMDSVTGERLTVDEALRKGLVAPRIALLVLESLGSFVGLLWPETGEIIPVADALEQGILSTELIQEVLSKRQLLQAVLTPDTTEVLSWQKAVERGVLEREVVKKLKSMAIPDVMASVQLAGSPSRSRHSHSSPGRSPTGQEEPLLRSDDEKLMFHLMTHSYINIHDGQKVLLVDAELNNLTKTLIQSQENESCAQVLENFEETQADGALESEPCNGVNTLSPFLPTFEALISCLIVQIKFSKKMCLEHDQRLISYLSMLRDIEMRIKRVQPAEQNLAALHDLRQQAEVSEAGPEFGEYIWESFWNIFHVAPADGKQCSTALAAGLFELFFSPIQELKEPLAATKAELDATAFDIQFLISEHAQDLTPQQSRQLLRLLNELQKAFRDLSERVTARLEVLQVCLQQVEQTEQVKVVRHLLPGCPLLAEALPSHRNRKGDLPALQQRQSDELQRSMHSRAASFAGVLKSTEQFLEENKAKLEPGELAALQQDLQRAKEQYQSLQERTEVAQKELESAVSAAVQQETEKVKAAKELEENSNKIDSLLDWVASLEEKGALPEYRPHPVHQGTGTPAGKSTGDVPDGHAVGADSSCCHSAEPRLCPLQAQHQELLSQQQDVILAWQAAQAFLDKQGPGEERERLRARLAELRERYPASLARAEARLKRAQLLREELQKFLRDHGEFEAWLEQAEQDLQGMCKGDSDPASLRQLLRRQGSFSEDVISHKGDLRFVTMSGEKFLDGDAGDAESQLLMSRRVVKSKLEDATQRYTTLHSKCSKLGSHLNTLLDHYQQFQEVAESLRMWLQESEAALGKLLSETVSSDLAVLQKQLASTKQLQGDLAEHQVPVEKLQKAARTLLDIQGEPAPDHGHIQETTDAIVSRFQSLSQQMSERSDLLQKSIAQSQSVQESLESLLQSVAEVEKNLEKDQPAVLSSASIQDSLKLKQDIARQRSCLEATREMVTRFTEAADSPAASALQDKLAQVTEHFGRLCQQQQEREDALKGLLPTVEQYEQLWERLQQFTESRTRMLASGNQPDRGIAHFSQHIQVRSCGSSACTRWLRKGPGWLSEEPGSRALTLQNLFTPREKDASSCQEQLDEFRDLVGAVRKWLRESEGKIPPAETSLGTQELQQHRQQIQVGQGKLESSWESVEMLGCETNPRKLRPGGRFTVSACIQWLAEQGAIQCDVSEVRRRYQALGAALQERQQQLSAMLDRMQEVQEEASSMLKWLESKERMLSELEASSSPTKTETMRAQAEHNKAFLAELEQNSGKIQKVKEALSGLLEKYPDSPEAANWKKMQEDLSKFPSLNQATAARQQKLEESASQLATFQATEAQLRPWLMEKELMMSVLGPLSIDPNMLNAQKQQVQFMLKEFEARRQQHEQLNQAAQSILTGPGDVSPSTSQVRDELQGVNQKWSELTERLNSRSSQIDQAIVKSTQYQELLQGLSEKVKAVGQRLSSQSAISTQPDAVKQQLEETSEIRSDLEQLEEEISEAQNLCDDLSVLIGEQYLKDELRKPDRMNRLQTALASSQQFQHMFDELRTWLDDKRCQQAQSQPISAKLERLQSQIQEQEEFQKSLNQHSGSYEMIVAEGESLLLSVQPGEEKTTLQNQLVSLKTHWEELSKQAADRHSKLKDCLQKAQKYQRHADDLLPWVEDCKARMAELEVTLDPVQLEATLLRSKAMLSDVEKRRSLLEMLNSAADILTDASQTDEDDIRDEKASINQKMDAITEELQTKTGSIEEMSQRLKEFQESFKNIEKKLEGAKHQLEIYDALGPQACSNKNLEKLRAQQEVLQTLEPQVEYLKNLTQGLVEDAPAGSDCSQLLSQAEVAQQDFKAVKQKVNDCCALMENKLEGIGQFNSRVREMFSQLADLDDELDSMGPIGRDSDSLQSQAEDVRAFLGKLQQLKSDIESSESECRKMLEDEGSPDLLGLKRELETLNKQCSKLTERGRSRQEQVETTLSRVEDFYSRLKELSRMTAAAEEHEALQWVVGTEVETINQQLADFKQFQKEQVDPLQLKLQQVNGVGQGLIQSAGKNCDVQGLEHDMEEINTRWNTLNKKVAQRVAQLQEALLHCGKFQDALEPLLSWLADTEELISNQKPPSAEYKVVKAQIQEQKLLQRLLDDRKATVEMIQAEGDRIAQAAEPADRDKIVGQLESLARRWEGLLGRAAARQKQLEDILVLAKQFHETTEPVSDWLSVTEKKLANSEPIGTQTAKIQQQISRHKALEEEIESHATNVSQALGVGQSLSSLSCAAEQRLLAEKLEALQSRYGEVRERCGRKAALLDQALANARLFGEEEVEVLNWLAEVEDKLGSVSIKDYKRDVLITQICLYLQALNEEIVNRKKNVDQAIRNGQALLKQTTGEEVLLIQEKLDGIKTRYSDITAASSKALRTLEQARQLATKFQSTHEELTGWMSKVEDELASSGAQSPAGEQIPQFQQRQKELKKEVMEHRLVLDTVNEVSRALLELVPWRAREGLDKLVSDTNERYKLVSDTIKQRVEEIDAAIQRSQQYEQAADAELAWVAETKRKLMALGPIRLEQDQTTAQLQVQKAFSIDIIRHKDSMDELFSQRNEIFGTCGEEQKALLQQYEAVSQLNSERYARLERAQVLVNQFWETYEELNPWIEETQALISQLPPPAIDHEQLKQQQDDMRQLRESIAEHKPHIDKLLKIGPQLKDLNPEEGEMVQEKYSRAEALYAKIKEEVCQRALALDEAFSQSTQFHDKIEPMLETLEGLSSRLRLPPLIPAEVDKIRECISENKNSTVELEKLQPSFEALKRRGEELIARSQGADKDLAAKVIQDKLDQMVFFWEDIKARTEEREMKFLDVLELAEKFWYDMAALLTTIKDTQDIVHDLESPGIDPSIIKQQVEAAEVRPITEETDGLHEELEFIRLLGTDLIFACGETEKPEVKKSIDEMNNAWENLNKTWKERLEKLEEAMQSAVQYQDTLQAMFDWLDNAVIKLCNMSPVGTDLSTVKEQMNEMKEFKMEVYQQQIEMEKLNHQGELMLKKATDETDRDIIKEPLTELKHLWENLGEKIAHRQHKLEAALLALGQFQHALAELMAWLTHTEELLDAQKPINGDPKVIEVELAKHHVLKNDVLAHQATVETVNKAGNELLESSAGDDASSLRNRLEKLNSCWESVLQKTEEREQQLQSTLQQAQGFHGEIEDFLLWLTRMESQLSASKPTGGLPETAREQLNAHMVISQERFFFYIYIYMLLIQQVPVKCQHQNSKTEQSVALLEQKWCLVSTKMEERKAKLEEALALATDFQNSLQDFINWLTLAEQSLNIAPPPSLILAAVLAQIDEHKVFANEVNAHRDRIIELDQTGNQLKFLSQKQDVVLIKNLLVSVQSRWEKVVQRSVERGRALDDARKRAKQFHEAWKKLIDWLEDAENHLDSELEISNDPDKIKLQLSKHKEFQKTLGGKQPVYDTTIRTGRALKEKALLSDDTQKLDNLLGEVRDKWDTVCGKSVERQHKLEEALLFSGQFMDALQALVDWLYKVEPQLAEDQPVHGDLDLVMNLMDAHKVFQKELGKRTGTVQVLKRSGRELIDNSRDDTTWVKVQLQELSNRWDTVCKLSVSKQTRLEQALKQAEEFRTAVHMLLEWLSEAEQSLRFRGALPDDAEALQALIDAHKEFMKKVEEKRVDVNAAVGMGEVILGACHPDCITTIKHWITIIRARFEEVLTWAKQHQQRLESALSELVANAELLEELLAWIQWAETTLIQRDQDPMPQNIDQVKALISEHQSFMEEMTRKQPDVDRVTKTYKRKVTEPPHGPFIDKSRKCLGQAAPPSMPIISQSETKNPRINQLSARWQQVWLLALERQRKLNDALDRLEELKEFANFDFDVWRKKYMRWMNHKKSRVMDFFRRIDKDQDGKITRQEFIDGILASKFPTTKLEMTAVADIFDRDGDGYIDYYEFVAALHPNKDAYRPTTDADKIEDEVTRQVAQCKCAKRFQVEQIGENKYRFGDSQQLRLVRILRSTVMVRVGGGWMALDEFLVKNDPCRGKLSSPLLSPLPARGRTNLELREKFILPEGASQGMTPFRSRGRRSKPSSRAASPTRSSSSASQSNHSCASMPSSPATPTPHHFSRCYDKPWLINSKAGTPLRGIDYSDFQLPNAEVEYGLPAPGSCWQKILGYQDTQTWGSQGTQPLPLTAPWALPADPKKAASRPTSRAGSRTGSRASSRRGSDASDFDLLETQSACSDTSESSAAGGQSSRRAAKPSKIPTMSKKTPAATPKTPGPKR